MATWSFVLIPDVQYLATPANGWSSYYNGLRDWIIANQAEHDIQFVGGLGDLVHLYGDLPSWDVADTALSPLLDLDIPVMLLASGNHDTDTSTQTTRALTIYNGRFGVDKYDTKPWFGGVYETGKAQNMWGTFSVGGHDYLVFMLEFFPRDGVLAWVQTVAAANPDHRVMVITHAYLYLGGVRDTWTTDPYGVSDYFTQGVHDANPGEDMWQVFKTIPGLWGVFNGHHIYDNVAYRIDANDAGQNVLQGFYNWQQTANGGKGRVVLMTVDDTAGTIHQRVVRTDLDTFETGTSAGFAYDVTHQVWDPIGTPPIDLDPGAYVVGTAGGQIVVQGGVPKIVNVT